MPVVIWRQHGRQLLHHYATLMDAYTVIKEQLWPQTLQYIHADTHQKSPTDCCKRDGPLERIFTESCHRAQLSKTLQYKSAYFKGNFHMAHLSRGTC